MTVCTHDETLGVVVHRYGQGDRTCVCGGHRADDPGTPRRLAKHERPNAGVRFGQPGVGRGRRPAGKARTR